MPSEGITEEEDPACLMRSHSRLDYERSSPFNSLLLNKQSSSSLVVKPVTEDNYNNENRFQLLEDYSVRKP